MDAPPQENATARVLVTQAGVTLHTNIHTNTHTYYVRKYMHTYTNKKQSRRRLTHISIYVF